MPPLSPLVDLIQCLVQHVITDLTTRVWPYRNIVSIQHNNNTAIDRNIINENQKQKRAQYRTLGNSSSHTVPLRLDTIVHHAEFAAIEEGFHPSPRSASNLSSL